MTRLQFGLCLPDRILDQASQGTYLADLQRALEMISGHFASFWMVDHLQFGKESVLESFTTLGYLAALHPQLVFGHAVLCQSFRNPALVAKMASTLQFLSGGRYVLGLGAGWHAQEYRAYGYDFPPNRVRVAQLAEALQIIRLLWTQETANFEGSYYRVQSAHNEPRPNPPPPIMLGAFGPRMLRLTAQHAD